jgi:hypothetical protein
MMATCYGPIPEANDNRTAKRRRLESVIEIAIALLDAMDGDEDLEETGDLEPYLGWVGAGPGRTLTDEDREEDAGDEPEPDTDDEPWLGWTAKEAERGTDYSPWASRLPFLDGEICAGDEPEFEDDTGEAQELYAGIGGIAIDRSHQEVGR